jgi:hypothetical protein
MQQAQCIIFFKKKCSFLKESDQYNIKFDNKQAVSRSGHWDVREKYST